jgi:hypothetical protein
MLVTEGTVSILLKLTTRKLKKKKHNKKSFKQFSFIKVKRMIFAKLIPP